VNKVKKNRLLTKAVKRIYRTYEGREGLQV